VLDEEELHEENAEEMESMSFGDHLDELRRRLIYSIGGFLLFFVVGLFFQEELLEVLVQPHFWAQDYLKDTLDERRLEARKNDPEQAKWEGLLTACGIELDNSGFLIVQSIERAGDNSSASKTDYVIRQLVAMDYEKHLKANYPPDQLVVLKYQESFLVYMKVCAVFALLLGIPFTLYNFWKFIATGLYHNERKVIYFAAPLSLGLFAAGILFGYFLLIRYGLRFLVTYGDPELIRSSMTLSFYFSLFVLLTLVVGIVFQLPMIMLALGKIGIVTPSSLRKHRKIAILLAFIVGAFLTPPEPFTQIMLALPVVFLYEFGIILVRLTTRDEDAEDSDTPTAEAKA